MNCPARNEDTVDVLIDYCAGKLPVTKAAELQSHLAVCPECRAFTQSQSNVWTALDVWEEVPVSSTFDARLQERIDSADRKPRWREWIADRMSWRPAVSIAAGCAAVAAILMIQVPQREVSAPPTAQQVENTRGEAIEPEQLEMLLDDLEMLRQLSVQNNTQSL